jgi:hypothetical protein
MDHNSLNLAIIKIEFYLLILISLHLFFVFNHFFICLIKFILLIHLYELIQAMIFHFKIGCCGEIYFHHCLVFLDQIHEVYCLFLKDYLILFSKYLFDQILLSFKIWILLVYGWRYLIFLNFNWINFLHFYDFIIILLHLIFLDSFS